MLLRSFLVHKFHLQQHPALQKVQWKCSILYRRPWAEKSMLENMKKDGR
jgi:hypothetical protein